MGKGDAEGSAEAKPGRLRGRKRGAAGSAAGTSHRIERSTGPVTRCFLRASKGWSAPLRAADPNLGLRQMLPLLAQFDEEGSKLRRFPKPRQQWIGLEQRVTRKAVGGGLLDPVLRACEVSELRVDSANRIGGVMKVDEPPSTRDRLV